MEYKRFNNTIVARLDKDEEIISTIEHICIQEHIDVAMINGIGAVDNIVLGIFDTENKSYYSDNYSGDFEIVSLSGNFTRKDENPYLHLHMSIANNKTGQMYGGHLSKGIISATGEIFITVIDGKINRVFDESIGLNLLKFD